MTMLDEKTNKELDKQTKQEQQEQKKEENKKTLKTVIASVICALLFIIILLLLILLGLKKCALVSDLGGSSNNENTSSQYVEIYDNKTLDNVFKKIVREQRRIDTEGADLITPKDVIAVTCSESDNKFNLSITLTTEDNRMFFYAVTNCNYKEEVTGYDNLITYLLSNDEDQNHIFMGNGDITLNTANVNSVEVINTNKPNSHFVTSISPSSVKYISGYYYQENRYYVYNRLEYTDQNNPLGDEQGTLIDDSSLLYGYYLRISGVITD